MPLWIDNPRVPGGRQLNPQAFTTPNGEIGNLAGMYSQVPASFRLMRVYAAMTFFLAHITLTLSRFAACSKSSSAVVKQRHDVWQVLNMQRRKQSDHTYGRGPASRGTQSPLCLVVCIDRHLVQLVNDSLRKLSCKSVSLLTDKKRVEYFMPPESRDDYSDPSGDQL